MQDILDVKFDKFMEDFNLRSDSPEVNWRRFVNYHFFSQFQPGRLDTDLELFDKVCTQSAEFPQVHGAFFLMNDQIISEPQDIDDILQRDQKGLLELYFLVVGKMDNLIQQLERLLLNLDEMGKGEEWIQI